MKFKSPAKMMTFQLQASHSPTHVADLVVDPWNLVPQVFRIMATALFARLPLQHRRSASGKGSGGSCLSRHRVQCAGTEKMHIVAVCGMGSANFTNSKTLVDVARYL